jgi:hypothetical protein
VFALLAAAVLVARWLADDRARLWLRAALAALAVASVVPDPHVSSWRTTPDRPAFFADGGYEADLAPTDNVILLPYGGNGDSMLWQAESGFAFRMAGGYIRPEIPPPFDGFRAVHAFESNDPTATAVDVRAFADAKGVTAVVVPESDVGFWQPMLAPLGPPRYVDGVRIYRLGQP